LFKKSQHAKYGHQVASGYADSRDDSEDDDEEEFDDYSAVPGSVNNHSSHIINLKNPK